jgi:hypothetical protein
VAGGGSGVDGGLALVGRARVVLPEVTFSGTTVVVELPVGR